MLSERHLLRAAHVRHLSMTERTDFRNVHARLQEVLDMRLMHKPHVVRNTVYAHHFIGVLVANAWRTFSISTPFSGLTFGLSL